MTIHYPPRDEPLDVSPGGEVVGRDGSVGEVIRISGGGKDMTVDYGDGDVRTYPLTSPFFGLSLRTLRGRTEGSPKNKKTTTGRSIRRTSSSTDSVVSDILGLDQGAMD